MAVKKRHFSHKGTDKALRRNLLVSLFMEERIKTTLARAKEIAPLAEKLITKGKKDSLANLRSLEGTLTKEAREKIQKELSSRYEKRNGGYTRIIKLGPRLSDGAKMAFIELVK
jgi:large subunit ribosomal protein L17